MKKLILIFILFCFSSCFAEGMSITPKVEFLYGVSDFHDDLDLNPGLGGGVIFGYGLTESLDLEVSVSFNYWITDPPEEFDFTYWTIPILFGARYNFTEMFGAIGGLGFNYQEYSIEQDVPEEFVGGTREDSESETDFSLYFGGEFKFSNMVARPQVFFTFLDDDTSTALMVELGYRIGL